MMVSISGLLALITTDGAAVAAGDTRDHPAVQAPIRSSWIAGASASQKRPTAGSR